MLQLRKSANVLPLTPGLKVKEPASWKSSWTKLDRDALLACQFPIEIGKAIPNSTKVPCFRKSLFLFLWLAHRLSRFGYPVSQDSSQRNTQ